MNKNAGAPIKGDPKVGKLMEHALNDQGAKRVLMLCWEYPPRIIGGLARVVWAISKELADIGWEVHVVTADHPGTLEHELEFESGYEPEYGEIGKVFVHRVKTQTDTTPDFLTWVNRLNFGLLQYAIQIQQQKPFSIIHAHDWLVADAAWVMKQGFGIPIVSTIHATEAGRMHGIHTDLQRYIHQMEWRLTFESWQVIVNSKHMNEELKSLFSLPENKISIIPNGTNPDAFDFEFDASAYRNSFAAPHERIVLYVGRLVTEKGVQVLLDAVPKVSAGNPNTKFLIVGTGYFMDALRGQVSYLGIQQQVQFLGYVADDELKKLYKIADIVCIPSLYEPFGIVALEGMAANVPVVTSDTGGLTDFVQHMVTGVLTYTGDANSLAWGLLEVLRNPDLAKRLSKEAFKRVHEIYNWRTIAGMTSDVYDTVISEASLIGAEAVASTPALFAQASSQTTNQNRETTKQTLETIGQTRESPRQARETPRQTRETPQPTRETPQPSRETPRQTS